jgi:methylated-DNA-protein-cysteine methyltransferase related protein
VDSAEYRGLVRAVVAAIPPGRVMSYGSIAAYLAEVSGRASPRLVGHVMAIDGDGLPWHRVVRESGHPVRGLEARALRRLRDEHAPLGRGGLRVEMGAAAWSPDRPPAAFVAELGLGRDLPPVRRPEPPELPPDLA